MVASQISRKFEEEKEDKMWDDLWDVFCDGSRSLEGTGKHFSSVFSTTADPYSCINNALAISVDVLFLSVFLFLIVHILFMKKNQTPPLSQQFSKVKILSTIWNGVLGFGYLLVAIWIICQKLSEDHTVLPLHLWLEELFQGFTWLLMTLCMSLKKLHLQCSRTLKLSSVFAFLYAGFRCVSSLGEAIVNKEVSVKIMLDVLSFPGSGLFLLFAFGKRNSVDGDTSDDFCYEPLQGAEADATGANSSKYDNINPFSGAGFLSKMSFWWLNPLMKKGKERILEEEDIPRLWEAARAETCYSLYMEQLGKQIHEGSADKPSMVSILFKCHWKAVLISAFFALIKVVTLSTGPLFLRAFIEIAVGEEVFENEAYVLAAGLFLSKCLESLSERQWFFRTRLLGLQVRSLLCAAIYQKQLKLSNAARMTYSLGEIVNYVTVDAYKIGEFPYWFHQIWTTVLQLCLALLIVYYSVGVACISAVTAVILIVLVSSPLAKLQLKYQKQLMRSQGKRVKRITEALANMKVLKLYAWDGHFNNLIRGLREEEFKYVSSVLLIKGYNMVLFWSSPILVPAATFLTCYFLGIPLNSANVFTFLATLRIVQEPVRMIPEVFGIFIEAKVSLDRIAQFLEAPELTIRSARQNHGDEKTDSISVKAAEISWEYNSPTINTLKNINLVARKGEKVAICGEVGSGKSTLLAAVLGETKVKGMVHVHGKIAYVAQSAWIQTGTIQENILFGSMMDQGRYQEVLEKCCLVKDLEMLPFGDLTVIGERGVNLSGGQKQRVQLARALYQDADIYLLDDPFSALDAHTATRLFNEYVMDALAKKTVLLVTHQVDFLPVFDSILLMSQGEIIRADTYDQLLASSKQFQDLVNVHTEKTVGDKGHDEYSSIRRKKVFDEEIKKACKEESRAPPGVGEQLIKREERETGDTGLKPYMQYLSHNKGFLYFSAAMLCHIGFVGGQIGQNYWMAAEVQNSDVGSGQLVLVYTLIGCALAIFLLLRSLFLAALGCKASQSVFSILTESLFRAPMSFYDSTPLGRILSRVSSDLSIVDIDLSFRLGIALGSTIVAYSNLFILALLSWPVVFAIVPTVYLTILLQRYYAASSRELMRITGTTGSQVASYLSESVTGAMTIRAFGQENRFFQKDLVLIDANASPTFHSLAANEWLIGRLEIMCAVVLSWSALAMSQFHLGASSSGFIGMALSFGLSLNAFLVYSVQFQCIVANLIVSVERLEQYMHIPNEAPEVIQDNRPPQDWPNVGKVELCDLKVRYQPNAPLVLRGISCIIEGGQKIGIVGRTGSGKTTLISALFRLVEPADGNIIIDGINISFIGLHDLRSHLGIIPQEPALFDGSVRYNLDPLMKHTENEIWEVLGKCQLKEGVRQKEEGLDSLVLQDGSNWSMGQRQLFCLGRAMLKKSRILVLDEATASIDNATDNTVQKTIRREFADCTVITVAHRIPTVMDCNMVLGISDGTLVEYDKPLKLMSKPGSLFGQLVKEYWSRSESSGASSNGW